MISLEGVGKSFGRLRALDGVSFQIAPGEVVGFLGPNGAGKTTTLRITCGFLAADEGRVLVGDVDVGADPVAAQRHLGYLPEGAPLPEDMRVARYLEHRARLKGAARGRVEAVLRATQTTEVARRRIGELSRGTRQRVGLADALVADPPVLILDEPTAGLDPNQLREVRLLLAELARERTVLLSTHLLAEVEALATRVVIIREGRIVADASVTSLRAVTRARVRAEASAAALAALGEGATEVGAGLLQTPLPPEEVARRLVAAGIDLLELTRRPLEDLFGALTLPS